MPLLTWMDQIQQTLFSGYDRESVQAIILQLPDLGAITRPYYALEKDRGMDQGYSIDECDVPAKNLKWTREDQNGVDVDIAITTRELARRLIKHCRTCFTGLRKKARGRSEKSTGAALSRHNHWWYGSSTSDGGGALGKNSLKVV